MGAQGGRWIGFGMLPLPSVQALPACCTAQAAFRQLKLTPPPTHTLPHTRNTPTHQHRHPSHITGDGSSPHDFLSRFFAPWAGIPEDPVTGSAHSVLGPYWARRLGRQRLAARQCSVRGGELRVTVDESAARVEIAGHAVLVLRGRLLLPSGSMEGSTAGQ